MASLEELTEPALVFPRLAGSSGTVVLREMADLLAQRGYVSDAAVLHDKLLEREGLGSTAIGRGVAIPHCKLAGLERVLLAVGVTQQPVEYGAVDGQPVRLFFLVVSPSTSPAEHLQCLAAISRWVKADRHVERILALDDAEQIYDFIREEGS